VCQARLRELAEREVAARCAERVGVVARETARAKNEFLMAMAAALRKGHAAGDTRTRAGSAPISNIAPTGQATRPPVTRPTVRFTDPPLKNPNACCSIGVQNSLSQSLGGAHTPQVMPSWGPGQLVCAPRSRGPEPRASDAHRRDHRCLLRPHGCGFVLEPSFRNPNDFPPPPRCSIGDDSDDGAIGPPPPPPPPPQRAPRWCGGMGAGYSELLQQQAVGEGPRALLQSIREGGETALERVGDARAAEGGGASSDGIIFEVLQAHTTNLIQKQSLLYC